jgi:hypothetical protein
VGKELTRSFAAACHEAGTEGIVCRSASLARMGLSTWTEPHEPWGEVAIFTRNCKRPPVLLKWREDLNWFLRAGLHPE